MPFNRVGGEEAFNIKENADVDPTALLAPQGNSLSPLPQALNPLVHTSLPKIRSGLELTFRGEIAGKGGMRGCFTEGSRSRQRWKRDRGPFKRGTALYLCLCTCFFEMRPCRPLIGSRRNYRFSS